MTTTRIAELNDLLRTTFLTGRVLVTEGVRALPDRVQSLIVEAVQTFEAFGAVTVEGHKVFWKIDNYAPDMRHGAEDASNPARTRRVLTTMLAREY